MIKTATARSYVALMRGVNVGGHSRVSMQNLKVLFSGLGLSDVATYLQSGNVVFKSTVGDTRQLTRSIENEITDKLAMDVSVILRSGRELEALKESNPFVRRTKEATQLHVTFLGTEPKPSGLVKLRDVPSSNDEFIVAGREIFLWCPDGYARTKLNNTFFERQLRVRATTRNWRTVVKLGEMTAL